MDKDKMFNHKNPNSPEFSSNEQANPNVSEVFKRIDLLIRNGEITRAQEELKKANQAKKASFQRVPFSVLASEKCIFPNAPLPLKPVEAMITSINPPKREKPISPPSYVVPAENTQINEKHEQAADRKIEFEGYRKALYDAWNDGALTESEARQLAELRTLLEISDNEHKTMEKEVKQKCFKDVLLKCYNGNPAICYDTKTISNLRQTFQITENEYAQIQSQLLPIAQKKRREKILIIDDEVQYLKILASSISEDGFDVIGLPTSDEAYFLLQQQAPDLILCDINLKSSSMNGFTLYSKIQELKHLQRVPFIFLTGLAGEEILRTVKELGADDCLVKPFTKQALLSTIHGKLKRFKQLENLSTKQ
jgi:CheY-like chemotaxis protein